MESKIVTPAGSPESVGFNEVFSNSQGILSFYAAAESIVNHATGHRHVLAGCPFLCGKGTGVIFNVDGMSAKDLNNKVHVSWPGNYYDGEMSLFALSVAASIMASSILSFSATGHFQRELTDNYYNLMDYAELQAEAGQIYRLID